jgi:hypothetical protein
MLLTLGLFVALATFTGCTVAAPWASFAGLCALGTSDHVIGCLD